MCSAFTIVPAFTPEDEFDSDLTKVMKKDAEQNQRH